jgi:hypothetical protein
MIPGVVWLNRTGPHLLTSDPDLNSIPAPPPSLSLSNPLLHLPLLGCSLRVHQGLRRIGEYLPRAYTLVSPSRPPLLPFPRSDLGAQRLLLLHVSSVIDAVFGSGKTLIELNKLVFRSLDCRIGWSGLFEVARAGAASVDGGACGAARLQLLHLPEPRLPPRRHHLQGLSGPNSPESPFLYFRRVVCS